MILMIFSTERRQKDNRTTNTPPRTTKHKTSSPGKRGKPSPRKRKTPPRSKNEVKKDRPLSRETNTTVSPRRRRKRLKKKRGKQGEENISSASSEEDDRQCVSCHQPVSGAIMFAIFYFVFTYFVQHIRYATHTGYAEGHYVSCEECHGTLHPPSHENGFCLRKKDGRVFCSKRSLKTQTLTSNNQLTRTPNI